MRESIDDRCLILGFVDFGILHHIPKWREVVRECFRVLRPGGRPLLEEPTVKAITVWDAIFHWGHPKEALFTRQELEDHLTSVGFSLSGRRGLLGFWSFGFVKDREGQRQDVHSAW